AMDFFLYACQHAGPHRCAFASADTHAKFDHLMTRLRHHPVVLDAGQGPQTFTYAAVIDALRGGLTFPPIWPNIGQLLQATAHAPLAGHARTQAGHAPLASQAAKADAYDNSQEALLAVACSETDNSSDPAVWDAQADLADDRSPYFGADWTYVSAACAG